MALKQQIVHSVKHSIIELANLDFQVSNCNSDVGAFCSTRSDPVDPATDDFGPITFQAVEPSGTFIVIQTRG